MFNWFNCLTGKMYDVGYVEWPGSACPNYNQLLGPARAQL